MSRITFRLSRFGYDLFKEVQEGNDQERAKNRGGKKLNGLI